MARAKKLDIPNISERHIYEGFIKASKDANLIFYGLMKSRNRISN